jgi:hypothetical protein
MIFPTSFKLLEKNTNVWHFYIILIHIYSSEFQTVFEALGIISEGSFQFRRHYINIRMPSVGVIQSCSRNLRQLTLIY